jgi:cold shock CspA family protein
MICHRFQFPEPEYASLIRRSRIARSPCSLSAAPKGRRQQSLNENHLHLATCRRWNRHRNYGFLLADARLDGIGEDREIYCHKAKLPKGVPYLESGQRVEFELVPSHVPGKQPMARVVRILDGMAEAA